MKKRIAVVLVVLLAVAAAGAREVRQINGLTGEASRHVALLGLELPLTRSVTSTSLSRALRVREMGIFSDKTFDAAWRTDLTFPLLGRIVSTGNPHGRRLRLVLNAPYLVTAEIASLPDESRLYYAMFILSRVTDGDDYRDALFQRALSDPALGKVRAGVDGRVAEMTE